MKSGHPEFYKILEEMAELHDRKNRNYSKDGDPLSNFQMCEEFGIPAFKGILVRMSDKWSRITQLAKGKPDEVGESIEDTLKDMAIYSILAIILFREKSSE